MMYYLDPEDTVICVPSKKSCDNLDYDKLYANASCRCECKPKRNFTYRRRSNDFLKFVTLIILISCTQTCLAASSHRRLGRDWGLDSTDSDSRLNEYNDHCDGKYLENHSLSGGTSAGTYTRIGKVDDIWECANLCCQQMHCNMALMLLSPKSNTKTKTCFTVQCYDDYGSENCKPVSSKGSEYEPSLFIKRRTTLDTDKETDESSTRGLDTDQRKVDSSINNVDTASTMTNPDEAAEVVPQSGSSDDEGMCLPYNGFICTKNLDKTKLYYYSSQNAMTLDKRLSVAMDSLQSRLTGKCFNFALQAICYRFYPQCSDSSKPEPIDVCNNCNELVYGDCAEEFQTTNMVTYLKKVIPGCTGPDKQQQRQQPSNCIQKNNGVPSEENTVATDIPEAEISMYKRSGEEDEGEVNDDPSNTAHKRVSKHLKLTSTPLLMHAITTSPSTAFVATSSIIPKSVSHSNISTHSVSTTVTTLRTTTTTKAKKEPAKIKEDTVIKVSAGDDTTLTLPTSSVTLFASTWPKEKNDGDYMYKWSQVSSPKSSQGYIAGENTKNVKLTKLLVEGVYTFKLEVSTVDKEKHGVGYVNVTVKKPTRVDHPPRAEITQKEHIIQLPVNTVILDGSKSTDDDKIVSYKWEELEGPIEKKHREVFVSNTDSILQLKDLVVGVYKFRLTVTDSSGLTDKTDATVTVKKETDYPPKAHAGSDVVMRLPMDMVVLNGNQSTDDKGVDNLKYQWSKTADSPTCDMQGTDKSQLKLSSLQEGTYIFVLKVTDESEHTDEARVKVLVLPEKNSPPVALAGDDKEIMYPDDSTTLDASKSSDNSKIISYHWEQTSGPSHAKLTGANDVKVHLSDLVIGTYVMKLTVTDDKDVTGTDTVNVHVKKDHNEHPVAIAGKDVVVHLPTRSVVLDGSKSHDDELIELYVWTRAGLSPAAGVVINGSDHKAILRLTNLVKGRYMFDLTVTDNKGLTGTTSVTVQVKENPNSYGLIELHLRYDIESFTEGNRRQLVRKISVLLEVEKEAVVFEELKGSTYGKGLMILFHVKDPTMGRILDGKYVADILKQKIGFGGKLFEYTMQRVEPYICRKNCSDHGYCDKSTKECVCDAFWTPNYLKSHFGEKESNCDWSILYLSVAVFGLFLIFVGVSWSVCFCFARRKRNKRHARYHVLRGTDPEHRNKEILLIPNGKKQRYSADSLTFTESDDSADEATVFDKKKHANGHVRMKGSRSNGNGSCEDYVENSF